MNKEEYHKYLSDMQAEWSQIYWKNHKEEELIKSREANKRWRDNKRKLKINGN